MNGTSSTAQVNTDEVQEKIDALKAVSDLAHRYSRTRRATVMKDGSYETDGDHVIHLALIALAYALKYHPEIDPGKLVLYILLHDIDEAIVGDTNSLGATHDNLSAKEAREAEGRAEIRTMLADYPELVVLLDHTDDHGVAEHAFGKAFDKIVPGFTHFDSHGSELSKKGISSYADIVEACKASDERMTHYAADFPDLLALRATMHKMVARDAFGEGTEG